MWPQPLDPLHSLALSAAAAAVPLVVVLVLMGGLRKSGLFSALCGLMSAIVLAVFIWRMPFTLALSSTVFGFVYAAWPVLWIVFNGLWLYNVAAETGEMELLRRWMRQHASNDVCVQAILVAFCFGALIEGSAGFGTPVAVTAALLAGLGLERRRAVTVSLIANTTPVAFGGLGLPIVALAGVTGLDVSKLAAMVGRQLPIVSFILPGYLAWVVGRRDGLRRTWPAALVAGGSFSLTQFLASNLWGPYAADIIAACVATAALTVCLRLWQPDGADPTYARAESSLDPIGLEQGASRVSAADAARAWLPWLLLSGIMVLWSHLKLFQQGQVAIPVPGLHKQVLITLYQTAYAALYTFQPLGAGTAVLASIAATAACVRVRPRLLGSCAVHTARQLRTPAITVTLIIGLAYLYNYSGMAYTLGAVVARVGGIFPVFSSYLGWVACFLSGSDTASNVLFGNLQVAAARQLHLNPILLAATNSSGGVMGKMISPQNIAIGVTTVGLVGQEGDVVRDTVWHSIAFAALVGILAFAQAHWLAWMVP